MNFLTEFRSNFLLCSFPFSYYFTLFPSIPLSLLLLLLSITNTLILCYHIFPHLSLPLSLSVCFSLSISLSLTHTQSLSHTHTNTHTLSLTLSLCWHEQGDMATITFLIQLVYQLFPSVDYRWLTKEMNTNLPLELDFKVEVGGCSLSCNIIGYFDV